MAHEYQDGRRDALEEIYAVTQRDNIPDGCGVGWGLIAGVISTKLEALGAQAPCSHDNARQLNALTQWCPDCGALADKHAPMRWRWEYPQGAR